MRARSYTIFAKQSPYKKPNSLPSTPTSITPTPTPARSKTPTSKYSEEYVTSVFDCFGPLSVCKAKDAFSGDYQAPSAKSQDTLSSVSTAVEEGFRSRGISRLSDELFLEEEGEARASKLFRGMVIGARNSGKYALVNTLYPSELPVAAYNNVKFDLVTRTVDKETMLERYHFWLKEPGQEDRRKRELLNVYYRTCSVFFLVFNRDDRETFDVLEHEIEMIQGANRGKEVKMVLVSNRGAGRKWDVAEKEVQQLKDKYRIKMVLEVEELKERQDKVKEMILSLAK